ncbi:MAG TPA: sensor histidine kinase [Vicinamibacterales bacterium]|nr:sensor histidine kinase [Vicinamibacterales bacterium]
MRIRHAATRVALLFVAAAVVPLVAFGGWALIVLRDDTRQSVVAANLGVAAREAESVGRNISDHAALMSVLAAAVQDTGFEPWQQQRILRDVVTRYHEFRELTLFDRSGAAIVTSRVGRAQVALPGDDATTVGGVVLSTVHLDEEQLLSSQFAAPLRADGSGGWLVADISLEGAAGIVSGIRVGSRGYAWLADSAGRVLVDGDARRGDVAVPGQSGSGHPLLTAGAPPWKQYASGRGDQVLGVVARVPDLGWSLVIEQPASEAFAAARLLRVELAVATAAAALLTLVGGALLGRRLVAPVVSLERATQALAAGDFRARVDLAGSDEVNRLGRSFNAMADRLVRLQDEIKSQERQVMFGRVVAGLFHDLAHPIQNVANNARLLLRREIDAETRVSIEQTIDRELATLRRFMDDVLNVAKPRPLETFPVDVNSSVAEVVDGMRVEWERAGVSVEVRYAPVPAVVDADRFALGRVTRNLLANAIQATPSGGHVLITTARVAGLVEMRVADTGAGIPADRVATIFDDFVTTRRRGLGLGLATSRRIVDQLGGTISVDSEVGVGTTFTLRLPASIGVAGQAAN